MPHQISAFIKGIGSYLPEKILSNLDLEQSIDTSDEWIFSRTGIRERRLAAEDEFASTMGSKAATKALTAAGLQPEEIDLIIVATMTPDYAAPSTAALIQHQIGAKNAAAMDLLAACSGFIYGLTTAKAFIAAGIYKNVLLVASEKLSSFIDYNDRSSCILFGDGAAAVVVSNSGSLAIGQSYLNADGSMADLIIVPAGGSHCPASHDTIDARQHYLKLRGNEVFKYAVRNMTSAAIECLKAANMTMEEVDWLVPHQANMRIIDTLAKNFAVPERKVVKNIEMCGNTSAASIPIALDELLQKNVVASGENLLLLAFGAGLTWGAILLQKS